MTHSNSQPAQPSPSPASVTLPQRRSRLRTFGVWLASWFFAAVVGLILCILLANASYLLFAKSETGTVSYTKYGIAFLFMMSTTLLLLLVLVRSFLIQRGARFWRFFQHALIAGFIPTLLIGGGMYVIGTSDSSARAECSGLPETLSLALSATHAVITDTGRGSGFLVDRTTLITNAHVIEGAREIYTYQAGAQVPLTLKAVRADLDLAALTIPATDAAVLPLTSQSEQADDVYAVGFPGNAYSGGFASVSKGIVSRTIDSTADNELGPLRLIQTDAAINPGNSGGPLINECGAIGVTTAISSSNALSGLPREEGISYAVSAALVAEIFGVPLR